MTEKIWLRCPQEASLQDEYGNPKPCDYEWEYGGRHPKVANCPRCSYKVPIRAYQIIGREGPYVNPLDYAAAEERRRQVRARNESRGSGSSEARSSRATTAPSAGAGRVIERDDEEPGLPPIFDEILADLDRLQQSEMKDEYNIVTEDVLNPLISAWRLAPAARIAHRASKQLREAIRMLGIPEEMEDRLVHANEELGPAVAGAGGWEAMQERLDAKTRWIIAYAGHLNNPATEGDWDKHVNHRKDEILKEKIGQIMAMDSARLRKLAGGSTVSDYLMALDIAAPSDQEENAGGDGADPEPGGFKDDDH